MIFNLITKLLRQSYLHRGIALFFVLFIFLDITNPDICVEEFAPDSDAIKVNISNQVLEHTKINNDIIIKDQTSSDSHQTSKTNEGDCCFCCCSHWLMSKTVSIPLPITTKLIYIISTISLPVPPALDIFHPPCLS